MMGLQSVSQPIGKIIRYRTESSTGGSGWYIDGVEWTGAIRTVGTGKDFATIIAAVADANLVPEDCLYLIDAGTYDAPTGSLKYCYFRGLGATAADTIIDGATNFSATAPGNLFIENVWIYLRKASGNGPTIQVGDGGSLFTSNKSIVGNAAAFPAPGVQWPISTSTSNTNTMYLSYTTVIPTYTGSFNVHLMGVNRANMSLLKVAWVNADTPGWREFGCINTFALDDKALDGTSGYGDDYGSFRITQGAAPGDTASVSQPIGDIIRLRRNENNIPADASGNTISQLIAQTGIRLRRNTSNVPGD
jgi:hypothetical protein